MTGQSAKGMYDTFKRFANETMFAAKYIDPYAQNHPMPAERMAELAESGARRSTGTRRTRRSCNSATT